MRDALDEQIEAFERLAPTLKEKHPGAWVVVARSEFQAAFPDFAAAALYAEAHFPAEQVLIRNTWPRTEFAPFILVGALG